MFVFKNLQLKLRKKIITKIQNIKIQYLGNDTENNNNQTETNRDNNNNQDVTTGSANTTLKKKNQNSNIPGSTVAFRSSKSIRSSVPLIERKYEYDLIVIGGGSGGLSCAKEAGSLGAKVVVLDFVTPSPTGTTWGIGGTCVNVGCIPKKLMHHAALLHECTKDAKWYGWNVKEDLNIDWSILVQSISDHIKSLNWGIKVDLRSQNIEYMNALGSFHDSHTVVATFNNGQQKFITGEIIVIAVGNRPIYPDIPGAIEYGITSDDIFSLKTEPGKTCIIGAGYIGMECADFLTGLGYSVTLLVRSVVLRGFDRYMADLLTESVKSNGVEIIFHSVAKSIKKTGNGQLLLTYIVDNIEKSDKFDTILFAIGRMGCTKCLKLENVGVKFSPDSLNCFVDQNEQTNISNIYAVGDVTIGRPQLTPVAINAGRLLARRLFSKSKKLMSYVHIPTTVFTKLEYSCVGLSEEEAIVTYGEKKIDVYHSYYKPTEFFIPEKVMKYCYLKAIVNLVRDKEMVIGLHFIGPNAGEIIQGFAVAFKSGLTMETLVETVGIHPTIAEEFTRLHITKRSGVDPSPRACCS